MSLSKCSKYIIKSSGSNYYHWVIQYCGLNLYKGTALTIDEAENTADLILKILHKTDFKISEKIRGNK